MRRRLCLWLILFALCVALVPRARAWEQIDYDIFDLVDDVRKNHGENATFYTVLSVESTATSDEIARAHRKLSLPLHPDKNPSEEAQKEYVRLGAINTILKDKESRDRYEYFLRNGVPVWRGTGYYYKRHRPGLVGVLVALLLGGSAIHYLLLWVGWWSGQNRWKQAQGELAKRGRRTRSAARQTRSIIVKGYVVEENTEWPAARPSFTDVFVISVPVWIAKRTLKLGEKAPTEKESQDSPDEAEPAPELSDSPPGGARRTPRLRRRKQGGK